MFKKTPQFFLLKYAFVIATSLFASLLAVAQITKPPILDSTLKKMDEVQLKKYVQGVNARTKALSDKVEAANQKELAAIQKREAKLNKKLYKADSTLAKRLFNPTTGRLQKLQAKLQKHTNFMGNGFGSNAYREYIPTIDTLKTSMQFLQTKSTDPSLQAEAAKATANIDGLQAQFANMATIKSYLTQRNQELSSAFAKLGMGKELDSYKIQAYYYKQQVQEYKDIAKDPDKLEKKGIALLTKLPIFQSFMQKNSQLAALFPVPENYGSPQALAGLQTRASVQQMLQSKFGINSPLGGGGGSNSPSGAGGDLGSPLGAGGGAGNFIQGQLQSAQTQLSSLKDKANNIRNGTYSNSPSGAGGGDGEAGVAGFKPNTQKTKSFLKRLEYGFNIQSQRPNNLLPVTSSLAATVGYKLNDRNSIGIGASYNMGWGNGFNNIALSTQGAGLRCYIDSKIKGGFSITGGYEKNYMPALKEKLTDFYKGGNWKSWRSSALIGVTKKVALSKKKSSSMQLFYDLLNNKDHIKTQPWVFRVGWGF